MMVGVTTLVSTPIGILAGIYLAEFGATSKFAAATRFVTDIMLSAPSIVIGLFVYPDGGHPGHFSGWAGSLALSLIAIPVVVRTTENMLCWCPAACARRPSRWARRAGRYPLKVTLRAPSRPASSPASCWPSPGSPARPRRCCSPR
jgi:phosphate transport system permease protein